MPHMTDERVRAGLAREEDLSILHEVNLKTAGVSHLKIGIPMRKWHWFLPIRNGRGMKLIT